MFGPATGLRQPSAQGARCDAGRRRPVPVVRGQAPLPVLQSNVMARKVERKQATLVDGSGSLSEAPLYSFIPAFLRGMSGSEYCDVTRLEGSRLHQAVRYRTSVCRCNGTEGTVPELVVSLDVYPVAQQVAVADVGLEALRVLQSAHHNYACHIHQKVVIIAPRDSQCLRILT